MTDDRRQNVSLDDPEVIAEIESFQRLSPGDRSAARKKLLGQFPDLRDELEACLHGLELVALWPTDLADDLAVLGFPASENGSSFQPLGDFEIVAEIGRGGMGVVYEAKQLSLGRRVALKVLPFAAFLDERRLQRFRQEAQAAAILQHPNIVRVYCVGCERGVHYYAMELVEGRSLADVIVDLRRARSSTDELASDSSTEHKPVDPHATTTPLAQLTTCYATQQQEFFRGAARLGATLADAIQYAHEQGVVHRDLKPSNLLVDYHAKPWVTDFGLARIHEDRGLTLTGDLLGTIRYMSPEQASGDVLIDHRTDIYSLGISLYELVTLRPAFNGSNSQDLLRQITESSPSSPRAVQPKLPRDLETILLKATAFRAEDRYPNAAELASDLSRFLAHEPILARRPSQLQRCLHWVQRHRKTTALASTLLLLLLMLAVVGPVLAHRYARLAKASQLARSEILAVLNDTLTSTTETLENIPGADAVHERLLSDTLSRYEQLLQQEVTNQERIEIAQGCVRLAWVMELCFDVDAARQMCRRSIEILEAARTHDAANPQVLYALGDAYQLLGITTWDSEPLRRSTLLLQRLVSLHPDNLRYLKLLGWSRLYLLAPTRPRASEADYLAIRETWMALHKLAPEDIECVEGRCSSSHFLAKHYLSQGQVERARQVLEETAEVAEQFSKELFAVTRNQIGYAEGLTTLGWSLVYQRQMAEADVYFERAANILQKVQEGFPRCTWARNTMARNLRAMAESKLVQGQVDLAETHLREALAQGLAHTDQTDEVAYDLAWIQFALARILFHSGRSDEARQALDACVELAERPFWSWKRVLVVVLRDVSGQAVARPRSCAGVCP